MTYRSICCLFISIKRILLLLKFFSFYLHVQTNNCGSRAAAILFNIFSFLLLLLDTLCCLWFPYEFHLLFLHQYFPVTYDICLAAFLSSCKVLPPFSTFFVLDIFLIIQPTAFICTKVHVCVLTWLHIVFISIKFVAKTHASKLKKIRVKSEQFELCYKVEQHVFGWFDQSNSE